MTHIGHPLIGDAVYQNKTLIRKASQDPALQPFVQFPRQALHACRLKLRHPHTDKELNWVAALPTDIQTLLDELYSLESER